MWYDKTKFRELVISLLVEERGHTLENAERLVSRYPKIMINGAMDGSDYRSTAIALEMKDAETTKPQTKGDDENAI